MEARQSVELAETRAFLNRLWRYESDGKRHFDPDREWVFGKEQTASKSLNSPFYGWRLKGKALATIVNGKTVWREQN